MKIGEKVKCPYCKYLWTFSIELDKDIVQEKGVDVVYCPNCGHDFILKIVVDLRLTLETDKISWEEEEYTEEKGDK